MARGGAREVKPEHKKRGRKPDPTKLIRIPVRLEPEIKEYINQLKQKPG